MPSPELLSQRLVQAIDDRNLEALNRWLKHPRFDPERADNAKALLASLRHADAAVWLESLLSAGVPLRKVAGGSEAIHEAARLGNVAAVRWLLDKGVPANASSHYGTTILHGVLNGLGPVLPQHDDLVQLLWERTGSIEDLFGWQARHLREFVGKAPVSWVKVLLNAGWDPLASKPEEPSFWVSYLEKEGGRRSLSGCGGNVAPGKASGLGQGALRRPKAKVLINSWSLDRLRSGWSLHQ